MIQIKCVVINDNEQNISEEHFQEIPRLIDLVKDKCIGDLKDKWGNSLFLFPDEVEGLDKKQVILQLREDGYCAGNIMGFIGIEDECLYIRSRFRDNDEDYFFQYILGRVLKIPNFVKYEIGFNQEQSFYNWLIYIFPNYVEKAFRKGVFKTYLRKKYNDDNVRGTIDVARHIKDNVPFKGLIAYSRREYTCDNYLMELIRHTIEFIKRRPNGNEILHPIEDKIQQVIDATPSYHVQDRRRVIIENKFKIIRHAFYHEYRVLQKLCMLILEMEKHQVSNGTNKMYGILFDGAWLWEEYVNCLIEEWFYHPRNKRREGKEYYFDGEVGPIYPDFIGKDKEYRMIADAKYKKASSIRGDDYHQLLGYMFRFDAKKGFYLYPKEETPGVDEVKETEMILNRGVSSENNVEARGDISVQKHGLIIPKKAENFQEFISAIKDSEEKFVSELKCKQ